jgi:hypothetical protein
LALTSPDSINPVVFQIRPESRKAHGILARKFRKVLKNTDFFSNRLSGGLIKNQSMEGLFI